MAVIAVNAAFAAVFAALALSAFHDPIPHDIPVGIVAPAEVAHTIQRNLDGRIPSEFDLRPIATARRARAEIAHRRVDGALVVVPRRWTLMTAEAGGAAPMQAITNTFSALAVTTQKPLTTTDIVPPLSRDSQALSSYFLLLCVLFPSLATGAVAGHMLRRGRLGPRIGVLVSVAASTGLATAGIADGISGMGNFWAIAGIVALFSLAVSAPIAALGHVAPQLVALGVLAFLIVGIPVSGGPANLAAFEPGFLRWLHPGLPLGIAVDSIRNTVYFHGADTAGHLWVLAAYAAGGLLALFSLAQLSRPHTTASG